MSEPMSTERLKRLQELCARYDPDTIGSLELAECLDEILRLRAEVERLKAEMLSKRVDHGDSILWRRKAEAERDALRAALGKSQRFLQSVRHVFDHSGAMNATQLARRDYYLATLDALREKDEGVNLMSSLYDVPEEG